MHAQPLDMSTPEMRERNRDLAIEIMTQAALKSLLAMGEDIKHVRFFSSWARYEAEQRKRQAA